MARQSPHTLILDPVELRVLVRSAKSDLSSLLSFQPSFHIHFILILCPLFKHVACSRTHRSTFNVKLVHMSEHCKISSISQASQYNCQAVLALSGGSV